MPRAQEVESETPAMATELCTRWDHVGVALPGRPCKRCASPALSLLQNGWYSALHVLLCESAHQSPSRHWAFPFRLLQFFNLPSAHGTGPIRHHHCLFMGWRATQNNCKGERSQWLPDPASRGPGDTLKSGGENP